MNKPRRGRPPKQPDELHDESLLVRMRSAEKEGFRAAAELSGESLSDWVRLRLKQVAARELKRASRPVPFS